MLKKSNETVLRVEKLINYELTTYDDRTGQLRVDKSTWLRRQKNIEQAQIDVRNCRIELSSAVNLLTAYMMNALLTIMLPILIL